MVGGVGGITGESKYIPSESIRVPSRLHNQNDLSFVQHKNIINVTGPTQLLISYVYISNTNFSSVRIFKFSKTPL